MNKGNEKAVIQKNLASKLESTASDRALAESIERVRSEFGVPPAAGIGQSLVEASFGKRLHRRGWCSL